MEIRLKRVYDPEEPGDGFRALVDRLWPRGVVRSALRADAWWKDLAPSPGLRQWFHADPEGHWEEFCRRYREELDSLPSEILQAVREACRSDTLTLLTAARAPERSHAAVLQQWLRERLGGRQSS